MSQTINESLVIGFDINIVKNTGINKIRKIMSASFLMISPNLIITQKNNSVTTGIVLVLSLFRPI